MLASVNRQMIGAMPYFRAVNPGIASVVKLPAANKIVKAALVAWKFRKIRKRHRSGETYAHIAGDFVGGRIIARGLRPVRSHVAKAHVHATRTQHDPLRKNGIGGRSWYNGSSRQRMVIVFHDANRAGPHVDVHLGRLSVVYRVKPDIYARLRYNREGILTEESQKLLLQMVKSEIAQGARVPQNLDHSKSNARAQWTFGDRQGKAYGDGFTRQVIHESDVDIYKAHHNGPIEMFAPALNAHRALYMYRLYPGDAKRAPILIWGAKSNEPTGLEDRLHLTMVDEEKLAARADMATSTAKYDGASCYFIITPKGTTVWSPRISKTTGRRIEYTHKVNGIANLTNDQTIVGMGELLFTKRGVTLSAAQVGGILNAQSVLPSDVKPEIRIYRIDKVGRTRTTELPFWENRALASSVASSHKHLKTVDLMTPEEALTRGFEGVVAVPEGASVVDGFKMKWFQDADDWEIVAVDLKDGDRGGIAGVVRCVSLKSGKPFNLGPGQIGDHALNREMMENPDSFIGQVLAVESRHGHEGRAARVVRVHPDKGVAA